MFLYLFLICKNLSLLLFSIVYFVMTMRFLIFAFIFLHLLLFFLYCRFSIADQDKPRFHTVDL